jgi:transcriptional regulator with XRE-family HTH domain
VAKRATERTAIGLLPSEVFRQRLRERREGHGLSQAELARRMRVDGRPMSKVAVLRIEKGERGISLDEAIAFAAVLNVPPPQLFTPPEGKLVALTGNRAVDSGGMRAWLRYGDSFVADSGNLPAELEADRYLRSATIRAQALVDAERAGDKEGIKEAFLGLREVVDAYRAKVEEEGQ